MPRPMTRRALARLLAAGPAALALPELLKTDPSRAKAAPRKALSPGERRQLEKSVSQLKSTAEKLRKVGVPIGTEPAFVFRPMLPTK